MKNTFSLRNENHDFNIERFKTRLTAKSCVVYISVVQIIVRIVIMCTSLSLKSSSRILYYVSFLFLVITVFIIGFEYLLFRKIGPKVMNYSKIIDIILLILFTIDWIIALVTALTNLSGTNPPSYLPSSSLAFASFGWRTLFLLFLIQSWKFLIIPPTLAIFLVIGVGLHYSTTGPKFLLLYGIPPIIYTIVMMYFLDKIKWKEIFMNTQQERWMTINQFVLNNIPENIVIIELDGEVNFVSEYCKAFMRKVHLTENPHDLFTSITDLNQQPDNEPSSPSDVSLFRRSVLYFVSRHQEKVKE